VTRVLMAGAVALAGLSFLIPAAVPTGSGWEIVRAAKGWIGLAEAEPQATPSRRWGEGYVPNVPVVNQDGETFHFFEDLVRDKIVAINFIYTSCPDICPLTTARMAQLQERLGEAVGRNFHLISLSVDPENDTPEVLKEYSEAFGRRPGWQFLTGKPEDIQAIRYRLGDRRKVLSEHTQEIKIGNGATGEWQRSALLGDMESLVMAIRQMDPEWRNTRRVIPFHPAANTGIRYAEHPGQQTFRRFCAPCHTVGVGDRVGPDLRGVSERRDHEWLKQFIMDPVAVRRQGDPIALALANEYPGALMPRLGVGAVDAEELIAYIEEESGRLTEMEAEHRASHDHSGHGHDQSGHGHGDHDQGHGENDPGQDQDRPAHHDRADGHRH
jgi:protein SCO1